MRELHFGPIKLQPAYADTGQMSRQEPDVKPNLTLGDVSSAMQILQIQFCFKWGGSSSHFQEENNCGADLCMVVIS